MFIHAAVFKIKGSVITLRFRFSHILRTGGSILSPTADTLSATVITHPSFVLGGAASRGNMWCMHIS